MECFDARKKLKEYATDRIGSEAERLEMEAHINGCPVCKRELMMWQDLTEKQAAISRLQARLPVELKDRIKYRMQKNSKQPGVPPIVKQMHWLGGKGGMVIMLVLISVGLIYVLRGAAGFKHSGFVAVLIFFGFAILFLLLLFRKQK